MAVDVADLFRELDVSIAEGTTRGTWLLRTPDGHAHLLEPSPEVERITAREVRTLDSGPGRKKRWLLVGSSITPGMLERARRGEFDVLTETPLQLVVQGITYSPEPGMLEPDRPSRTKRGTRSAWTRWAVERCLILSHEPLRQWEIAQLVGSSQQAVSLAFRQLAGVVDDGGSGLMAVDKRALLEKWMDDYAGPGGQEFGWYSLDPTVKQTIHAAEVTGLFDANPLVSGDVAADRLAPWKLPSRGRIYLESPVDLSSDGFVPAPLSEATLITCVPRDPTLWRLTGVGSVPLTGEVALADAVTVYFDVLTGGDADSGEAAGKLAELIVGS